jgi:hypothetical protein
VEIFPSNQKHGDSVDLQDYDDVLEDSKGLNKMFGPI